MPRVTPLVGRGWHGSCISNWHAEKNLKIILDMGMAFWYIKTMEQINLIIRGCKDKEIKNLIRHAVQKTKRYLMPRMSGIAVAISIIDDYEFYGMCEMYDTKTFKIIMRRDDVRTMIETVIHEITHVKQYARKELIGLPFDMFIWKGETYNAELTNTEVPWEEEAYNMETVILKEMGL